MMLEISLDEAGVLKGMRVVRSNPAFDAAARDAVSQWKFRARRCGLVRSRPPPTSSWDSCHPWCSFPRERFPGVVHATPTQQRRAFGAWILVCIFWSTTFLGIRIGLETLPPFSMVSGARYIVAGLILGVVVLSRGTALPSRDSWPGHALLGFLMLGVGNGALVWAEQWVPSGMAAVMAAAIPFWMVGIEALLPSGERIRPLQFVGLFLGFGGLVLLATANSTPSGATSRQFLRGVIAVQVSCCGWSLGSAYSKRHARHENAFAAAAMQMVFGGTMLRDCGNGARRVARIPPDRARAAGLDVSGHLRRARRVRQLHLRAEIFARGDGVAVRLHHAGARRDSGRGGDARAFHAADGGGDRGYFCGDAGGSPKR